MKYCLETRKINFCVLDRSVVISVNGINLTNGPDNFVGQ